MREANKAASRERQLLLQQREEISRLRQQTNKVYLLSKEDNSVMIKSLKLFFMSLHLVNKEI